MSFNFQKVSVSVAAVFLGTVGAAHAGGGAGFQFLGGDVSYNGLIRAEVAVNTFGHESQVNQVGDLANGVAIPRYAGNPVGDYASRLDPTGTALTLPATPFTAGGSVLNYRPRGVSTESATGASDVFTRYVAKEDPDINYHVLRGELQTTIAWGDISLITRIRALYDPGALGYRDFNEHSYDNPGGPVDTFGPNGGGDDVGRQVGNAEGNSSQFQGKHPSNFGYQVAGDQHPLLFERSGRNYELDLPAFFLQYRIGNLTARLGNQSVAWGQLLFFRTFDTANGLDVRRHLIFNRAVEEYADVRESAPGLRLTYQLTDQITVDAFAQQFIPTILNNVNSPYNIVPSQFIIHDRYYQEGGEHHFNEGIKVKADFGGYDLEGFYTHRYNQLGAIRWTKSGVDKPLPNSNVLGAAFNQACQTAIIPAYNLSHPNSGPGHTPLALNNGCGPLIAQTSFETAPAGVASAEEWFEEAGYIKLDAFDGLNKVIDDFPAAQAILAQDVGHNPVNAGNELNAFFIAFEGTRGSIERTYHQENLFGLSGGYVLDAEPGSILDQLITHLDVTYTPRRVFTAVDLRKEFDKRDEIQVGLVAEKYQRFSNSFPATYLVFQYLWQKNEDLVGLLNDGYGSDQYSPSCGDTTVRADGKSGCIQLDKHVPVSAHPEINPGRSLGSNYVVFAFVQPFPAYIYEISAAALIDPYGGVLVQPGLQWKPQGDITVNLFYNYVNGHAWGGNANNNTIHLIDFANEVGIRLGYQF